MGGFSWNKIATPKVNYFVWRAAINRIPTARTLTGRGIFFGDGRCVGCGTSLETVDHLFASCILARSLWWQICTWLKMQVPFRFDSL
ncbi:putative reverse transcriptase zinc-binding domain-containing protein [Helianthus annuus]|nr:putative reverse transcriptase zinc-binding domain-containing protein [Helianthus annuus]